jgi:hypothetical protein
MSYCKVWKLGMSGASGILLPGQTSPGRTSKLSEANLSGADLYGVNLSGAKLTRTNLSGAQLFVLRPDLQNADLSETTTLTQEQINRPPETSKPSYLMLTSLFINVGEQEFLRTSP